MAVDAPQKNKLLVVDDNTINLETIIAVLGEDYDLRVAINGNTALDLILSGFLPDLVLLDILMPDIDGYEVCHRLKADSVTKDIPIIFLTALNSEEDEEKGLNLGAVDYITKPFNPAILRRRVQTHLELKKKCDQLQELNDKHSKDLFSTRAEAELGRAYLNSILTSAPVGIGLVVDRKLMWVNKRMAEMVGYEMLELEGQSSRCLYETDEEFERVGLEKYSQIKDYGSGSVDTQFITKEGSIIDVFLSSTPLDQNNLSAGVIFSALDITERKQQAEILSARVSLKHFSENHSVSELLKKSIDIIEKATSSRIGFFHFLAPDQETLALQTWSTNTLENMCEALTPDTHYPVSKAGVWVDCIHQKKVVIHNDYNSLPHKKGLPQGHAPVERELLVPVTRDGMIVAIIGVGNKLNNYTQRDADTAEKIADFAWDIIQHKQTEEAVKYSEEKFSRIFNMSPEPIGLSRASDGVFFEINPVFTALLGWTKEETLGRSSLDLNIWPDPEHRKEYFSTLIESGEVTNVETMFRTKSDQLITVSSSSRLMDINDEQYVLTIVRDLTPLRRVEASIVRAKEEWESTFDAMSDMVTILDKNMRIVRANQAAHDFWGIAIGDLKGEKCCDAFGGSAVNCDICPLQAAIDNGREFSEIITHRSINKTFQVTSLPIPVSEGSPEYFIHIVRDITEQRQLEKEADSANRLASLGVLAAGVAHEINNPNALILYNSDILNAILKDFLPSLAEYTPSDPQQLYGGLTYQELTQEVSVLLPGIHDSAQRIKRIVNDLRDFSRQDNSETDETIELNHIVETSVRLTHNAIKKATNNFTVELAGDLPVILGNSGRLVQVLINLLLNAAQALEDSSQVISISTAYDMKMDQVKVTVSDTGKGMTDEVLEHIFEPFITTKRDEGGTGLGLSISNRIVREHGGSLTFNSALGKGTSAILSFPVCKEGNDVN